MEQISIPKNLLFFSFFYKSIFKRAQYLFYKNKDATKTCEKFQSQINFSA